ncbi:MAG: hypothetical protein ABI317_10680, partial [Gaiellales bacterium]
MSSSRSARALLRLYPPAWRARYGAELEELLVQTAGGDVSARAGLDLVRSAARERLRSAGLAGDGLPPGERARGGTLLVLWAWIVFVLAGLAVQRRSEHWQTGTPAHDRALPAGAFDALQIGAVIGSAIVLAAIAVALPGLVRLIRAGRWPEIRRWIVLSTSVSAIAIVAFGALVRFAHGLDQQQRNGHDLRYSVAFVVCAIVLAAALGCWTVAATIVARRLELPRRVLRGQAAAAAGAAAAMAVMVVATTVWWESLASPTVSPLVLAATA